jgi:hypothetical protein
VSVPSSTAIPANQWTHLLVTYSLTNRFAIYLNGKLDSGANTISGTPTGPLAGAVAFVVGGYFGGVASLDPTYANVQSPITNHIEFFDGRVNNIVIHNGTELTATQARDRYFAMAPTIDIFRENTSGILTNNNISTTNITEL